jgi:hypothetical protein
MMGEGYMSSSCKKSGGEAKEQLVTITTSSLKEQLNKLYESNHGKAVRLEAFDQLWDLKEKALLEGKPSIDVPRNWLDQLDFALDSGVQRFTAS